MNIKYIERSKKINIELNNYRIFHLSITVWKQTLSIRFTPLPFSSGASSAAVFGVLSGAALRTDATNVNKTEKNWVKYSVKTGDFLGLCILEEPEMNLELLGNYEKRI